MTYLFLVGMVVLGLVVPRWWTIGVAIGIAIALAWLFDATRVHPALEPGLHFLAYFVTAVAAGVAAGIGVLVRRLGRTARSSP
jgi:polyferredoxin